MKRVRFSRTKLVHSPATPPISLVPSTPPSSHIPLTPPEVAPGLPGPSPYGLGFKSMYTLPPPLPEPRYPASILPHPLLDSPSILFDMIEHPSYIVYHHAPLSPHLLSESAFTLPIPAVTIFVAHLPWKMYISASNGSYLTIHDIFNGIYNALRKNIKSTEFKSLLTPKDTECAVRAYEGRYRRLGSSSAYEEEKRQGMKRIDFLLCMTRFAGLTETSYPDSWLLNHE